MAAPVWAPSPSDVAAHLPQRFRGGVPSEDTTPTEDQVTRLIELRAAEVTARCGEPPEEAHTLAAGTVALGVCAYLESSFFPEQQLGGQDETAVFFRMRYEEHIRLLRYEVLTHRNDAEEE